MPISYERDDAVRRITAIWEGNYRTEDVIEIFERLRREGAWSYGTLYDVRGLTGHPSVSDLRRILEVAKQPAPDGQSAGPIAVVVTQPVLYAMACAYAALGHPGLFAVFRDRAEADAWLATNTRGRPDTD
jgi:hypothetical protein